MEDVSLRENCEAATDISATGQCKDIPESPRLALTSYHDFTRDKPVFHPPDHPNGADNTCGDTLVHCDESIRENTSTKSKEQDCDNVQVVQETPLFSDSVADPGPEEGGVESLVVQVPLLKSQRITTKCVGETPLIIGINESTAEGEVSAAKERVDFNCPVPSPHTPSGSPPSPARLRFTSSTTDSDRTISLPPSPPPSTHSHTVTTQSPLHQHNHTPLTSSGSSTTPDLQLPSSSTSPSISPSLFITRQKSLGDPFSSKLCPSPNTNKHTVSPSEQSLSPCIPLQNARERREQPTTPDFLTSKVEETQLSVVGSSQKSPPPASTAKCLMTTLRLPRVVSRDSILPAGLPQGLSTNDSPQLMEAVSVIPDSLCPSPPFLETDTPFVTEHCNSPVHVSNISSVLQGLTSSSKDPKVSNIQKRHEIEELETLLILEGDVPGGAQWRETTPTQGEVEHEVVPESILNYTPPDHTPLPPEQTRPSSTQQQITEALTPENIGRVEEGEAEHNPPHHPPSKNTPPSCLSSNPPSYQHKTRNAVSPTLLKKADRLLKTLREPPLVITDSQTTIDLDCELLTPKTSQLSKHQPFSHHSNVGSTSLAKSQSVSRISRHSILPKAKQLENKGRRKIASSPRKPFSIKNTANGNPRITQCPITAFHTRHTHKPRKKDKTTHVINLDSGDFETETCWQMKPLPDDHPFMSVSTAPLGGSCGKRTSELAP